MIDKEMMKRAAHLLRDTAQDRDEKAAEIEKLSSEKTGLEKKIEAYDIAIRMAAEGDIDSDEIQEKVASIVEQGETKSKPEVNLARLMNNGIGRVKQASDAGGEADDPLTAYLYSMGS